MTAPADPSTDFPAYQLAQSLIPFLGGSDPLAIHVDNPDEIHSITTATPLAADVIVYEDESDDWNKKSSTIGAIPVASAQVAKGIREIANDGAVALVTTDNTIIIADSTTGNKAITTVSSHAGQPIWIRLVACTGNSYTLALVAGTLTLNAANETALIVRNGANTGWLVGCLVGATIV